jgi:hypothetical protein
MSRQVAERADHDRRDGEEDHDQAVHREQRRVEPGGDHAAAPAQQQAPDHRHRLTGVGPLPADHHGQDAAEGEEDQPRPEELLGDDLVVLGEDVLLDERRRRGVDGLQVH